MPATAAGAARVLIIKIVGGPGRRPGPRWRRRRRGYESKRSRPGVQRRALVTGPTLKPASALTRPPPRATAARRSPAHSTHEYNPRRPPSPRNPYQQENTRRGPARLLQYQTQ